MKNFLPFFAAAAAFLAAPWTLAQPVLFPVPLSPRIANYDIDVRLDAPGRKITGHEILRWRNATTQPARDLYFHLYLNGFKDSRTTFMKESQGELRGAKIDKDGWGWIDVTAMKLADGTNLLSRINFVQPDDGNTDDRTVFCVVPDKPVLPGTSIEIAIDFTAQLPTPPFARSGAKEEYFLVGQWFPKIGVLTDSNWNCHQYHATSEFFSDFGVYNVRMTVPEKNIVGATGVQVSVTSNGDGTATHWYHAEDVHDFAWTTSPEFVEFTGMAENVAIRVLMQKDHAYQGMRHVAAAQTAIEYFHKWYGNYPYPNLTVVDPRRGGGGSGGMEYPTLITAGTAYGLPDGLRAVEDVIIHEFGHNYWYGLVATNEFEESWLDEGINTYTEIRIMNAAYGPEGDLLDVFGFRMNDIDMQRTEYIFYPDLDPTVKKAWEYYSSTSYGINSYAKPGMILTTLEGYVGTPMMDKIMKTWFERGKFRHPTTSDFIHIANEISGRDLTSFFNQALFSNAVMDYSVDKIMISPDTAGAGERITDSTNYTSEVDLRRLGTFIFPVEVSILFDDGTLRRVEWDGKDPWKKLTFYRKSRVISAMVDPDRHNLLDVNMTNNSKTVGVQRSGVTRLSTRFLFWLQTIFDQPELLNFLTALPGIF
jgi:hypothetical protein